MVQGMAVGVLVHHNHRNPKNACYAIGEQYVSYAHSLHFVGDSLCKLRRLTPLYCEIACVN